MLRNVSGACRLSCTSSIYAKQKNIRGVWAAVAFLAMTLASLLSAATSYWDVNGTSAGLGGTGNWSGTFWNSDSTGGAGGTVSTLVNGATSDAVLAGTGGTLTIDTGLASGVTLGTLTVNSSGYTITSAANARPLAASSVVLANNGGLTLNLNSSAAGWSIGGVTLGTGATLTVSGAAALGTVNRILLNVANGTVSGGTIVLNGTGTGGTGFQANASGVSISSTIVNNSATSPTSIGAGSGTDLTLTSTAVISGSAGLLLGTGSTGGAGTVLINSQNTYQGATILGNNPSGIIKLGVNNALSTTAGLVVGYTQNTGTLDLNGHDQTIASLSSGNGGLYTGTITNNGTGPGTNTLTIKGTGGSAAFAGVISDGTGGRKTAVTLATGNTGTLTYTGANTYTGGTIINGGTLLVSGGVNMPGNGTLQVNGGGNFSLADGTARTTTVGPLSLTNGATLTFDWAGSAVDTLSSSAAATTVSGSAIGIILNTTGSPSGSNLTLLTAPSGLQTGTVKYYLVGATNYSATLTQSDTAITVGNYNSASAPTLVYWQGNKVTGTNLSGVDNTWTWSNGTDSNWSTTQGSYTATAQTPSTSTSVIFSATGATQQNTILGTDVVVNSVTFGDSTAVTIGGSSKLNLLSTGTGVSSALVVGAGSAALTTISANVGLGASQSWNVATGKTLAVSGVVSGSNSLTIAGGGTVTLGGANTYTGNTTVSASTLNVTGSWTGTAASSTLTYGGTTGTSIVNVSGNMSLFSTSGGAVAGSVSVYNQTAGNVGVQQAGNVNTSVISTVGYGYFNLTGGTYTTAGRFAVNAGAAGTGVVYVGGASPSQTGTLVLQDFFLQGFNGSSNYGETTIGPNGNISHVNAGDTFNVFYNSSNAYSIVNVAGGSLTSTGTNGAISFGNATAAATTGVTAFLNLAAGTVTSDTAIVNGVKSGNSSNNYINSAGGTLKAAASVAGILPATSASQIVTSTIYGAITNSSSSAINAAIGTSQNFTGGLTFDTGGFSSSITTPLLGATGFGVTQSNLSVTGGSGYVGAPSVTFTGGTLATNGSPASGYALINGSGQVVGIVITNPGEYSSASAGPTGVTLGGGGGTGASASVATLSANSNSGGLNVIGGGTLSLTGANTYGGGTIVTNGTLNVSNSTGSGTGTGVVAVKSGSKLQGSGSIAGLTTIEGGGFVQGGTASTAATLSFTGGLTLNSGSEGDFLLSGNGLNSKLAITSGIFTVGDTSLLRVTLGYTPVASDSFDLLDWFGSVNFSGSNTDLSSRLVLPSLVSISPDLAWKTSDFNSTGIISIISSAPEPSRAVLLMLGLVTVLSRRQRKARRTSLKLV